MPFLPHGGSRCGRNQAAVAAGEERGCHAGAGAVRAGCPTKDFCASGFAIYCAKDERHLWEGALPMVDA